MTQVETDPERHGRVAMEAAGLAEARTEINAGLFVDAADLDAWIGSIGTERELPPPPTRRRCTPFRGCLTPRSLR